MAASDQRRLTPTASTMASASSSSTLTAKAAPIATSTNVIGRRSRSGQAASWLRALEDLVGVARQRGLCVANCAAGGVGAGRAIQIKALDALVPAPQLLEFGFFFVEFGVSELLDLELVVDLSQELRALAR